MTLQNFIKKWLNHNFEDWGSVTSSEYKQFQREYKAIIRQIAEDNDYEIYEFIPNHYEFSCILKHTETLQFVYISISDVRYWHNAWYDNILYREMEHAEDWKGKSNSYCSLNDLSSSILNLVKYF